MAKSAKLLPEYTDNSSPQHRRSSAFNISRANEPSVIPRHYIKWLELSLFIFCIHGDCCKFGKIPGSIFTLILLSIYIYYTYYDDSTITTSLEIFDALDYLGFTIVRLLILYYFSIKFISYPWDNMTRKYYKHCLDELYKSKLKFTEIRLCILFILFLLLTGTHFYSSSFETTSSHNLFLGVEVNHSFRLFADLFSSIYGVYVPICLSQCVLSMVILKYELFLITLISEIKQDKDNNDQIEFMMNRYKEMYKTFIDEFKIWKYIIKMNLLVNFFILWVIVATMINEPMAKKQWESSSIWAATGLFYFLPIMEFVYSSSRLNNQYQRLIETLWNNAPSVAIKMNDEQHEKCINIKYIEYERFFKYVRYYKIMMGTKVTVINAIRCLLFFAIAKIQEEFV